MFDYSIIPEHMREGTKRYIDHGIPPGHFLTAILTNDLVMAVSHADSINVNRLKDWVKFVYNEIPHGAWGNRKKVDEWINNKGMEQFNTPLVIDTFEPSLFVTEKTPRKGGPKVRNPIIPEGIYYQFYIHGIAEKDLGFDIPRIIDGKLPIKEGHFDCIINDTPSELVLWDTGKEISKEHNGGIVLERIFKGLCYYKHDSDAAKVAMKCFDQKKYNI